MSRWPWSPLLRHKQGLMAWWLTASATLLQAVAAQSSWQIWGTEVFAEFLESAGCEQCSYLLSEPTRQARFEVSSNIFGCADIDVLLPSIHWLYQAARQRNGGIPPGLLVDGGANVGRATARWIASFGDAFGRRVSRNDSHASCVVCAGADASEAAGGLETPTVVVVAVEPSASNFKLLLQHAVEHGWNEEGFLPLEAALSDVAGHAQLAVSKDFSIDEIATLLWKDGDHRDKQPVEVITLSRVVAEAKAAFPGLGRDADKIYLLKLDIEGSEPAVLRSLAAGDPPVKFVSFEYASNVWKDKLPHVIEDLFRAKYFCFLITSEHLFPVSGPFWSNAFEIPMWSNFFCGRDGDPDLEVLVQLHSGAVGLWPRMPGMYLAGFAGRDQHTSGLLEVSLLSGRTVSLEAEPDESVKALRSRAQKALAVGTGTAKLLDSSGGVLDGSTTLEESGLQSGDTLTLKISSFQVRGHDSAFAAILGDGSVVTWGDADGGGNSSHVQGQLKDVQQIKATMNAFAAILGDGSVVTWGSADSGGDSSAVQDQLKDVQQIQATNNAFAAILGDGSVVTWGSSAAGGDSRAVQDQLVGVQQIQATGFAFAAILGDGSVVTWGDDSGDSCEVEHQLKCVQQIQASQYAFAAILGDGSVVTWGDAGAGGDSSAVQGQLQDVQQIRATEIAFAAILGDGSVVTWGDADGGGNSSQVQDKLKDVQQIQATIDAFAAVLGDGSVVTWGSSGLGGDSSSVQAQLKDVQLIQATGMAFAAILGDGSVVTWGSADSGGDSSAVQDQLKDVQQIQATNNAFAAILGDGSVVTWGNAGSGGDSSAVQAQLSNT
ncbi:hypothetical protein AK812_SmicGene18269 [Symbiodinium microadriaticum]|uniref:Ubiquitin-like domain-containing protein n=1 Tax=Symbiodinium microadriaticum TaxID=2951 RepID=A0A1Q9DVG7_SYMMI|nr:hypothetical protein AK812_SmicGene18269 [Symbiodinium microadriaticum]